MSPDPPERPTARVVLLDRHDRILLMKGRLPGGKHGPAAWFTVGGGVEPGETYLEAAAREIREETGILEFELGPVLWLRRGVLHLPDPTLMVEQYVLARCEAAPLRREGWTPIEQELIEEVRWWTLAELITTQDRVFPPGLADLMPNVLAGRLAPEPVQIPWL
jgi:8-oxo-dGTP diphosphatase